MNLLRRTIDRVVDGASILLILSMLVIVFAQVIFRYLVKDSPPWTEEFSRFNFIWLTFLGAVAVFRRKNHLVIDTLVAFVPPRVTRILNALVQTTISALLIGLFFWGLELCQSGLLTRASTMDIPLAVVYLSVPVSAVLMLFYELCWLVDFLKEFSEAK
jgi:TRAP-type transport system small permease protein